MNQVPVIRRSPSPSPDRAYVRQSRSQNHGSFRSSGTAFSARSDHLQVPEPMHHFSVLGRMMSGTPGETSATTVTCAPVLLESERETSDESGRCQPLHDIRAVNDEPPPYSEAKVDRFRRELKYSFMTPFQKWRAKRVFPYKLLVQLLKIVIVTMQLVAFGSERTSFVDYINRSTLAFRHMYLQDWDPSYETNPYPAAIGQYALYEKDDFYSHINFALDKYNRTREISLGLLSFPSHTTAGHNYHTMTMCTESFKVGEVSPLNETYVLNPSLTKACFPVHPVVQHNSATGAREEVFDVQKYLKETNQTFSFQSLHILTLMFRLKAIRVKEAGNMDPFDNPICLNISGSITYDNSGHNGQIPIQLVLDDIQDLGCQGTTVLNQEMSGNAALIIALDSVTLLMCTLSFILCMRSVVKSLRLIKATARFFKEHFQRDLSLGDKIEFLSFWFILILISDLLIIMGTAAKIYTKLQGNHTYTISGMILGFGNILVWLGVLRYLGFFKKYNTLLLTIKKAAPDMFRFLVCALVIYSSFLFCGWIVLGPYHVKFETISTTSECLFALINGDDMFSTFSIIQYGKVPLEVWLFSRAYVYLFSSSYIYLVLSLFIAVIMDAYETIRYCFINGFPKNFVQEFIEEHPERSTSKQYMADAATERDWTVGLCISKLSSCMSQCVEASAASRACSRDNEHCDCCSSCNTAAAIRQCSTAGGYCTACTHCRHRMRGLDDDVEPVVI